MKDALRIKSPEEKLKIEKWLKLEEEIKIEELTKEELINCLSCCKTHLNEELKFCMTLGTTVIKKNLYKNLIKAKKDKITKLVEIYNDSNLFNKIEFKNNVIIFDNPKSLGTINLDIEGFNYNYPVNFKIKFYFADKTYEERKVIPFNFNGLFSEYLNLKETNKTFFKIGSDKHVYFYSLIYNKIDFSLGTELDLKLGTDYTIEDGFIVIENKGLLEKGLMIKYIPKSNYYQVTLNKKIIKIELIPINDFLSVSDFFKKRLVINI